MHNRCHDSPAQTSGFVMDRDGKALRKNLDNPDVQDVLLVATGEQAISSARIVDGSANDVLDSESHSLSNDQGTYY